MKIKLKYEFWSQEDYYRLYLDDKFMSFQNKEDTIKKVAALIKMSSCDVEIEK